MIVLEGHERPVTALAYSPDGRTLATGGNDGHVKLWEALAGREVRTCAPQRAGWLGWVTSLSFSGDGRWLAAGFPDEAVVWAVSSGQMLHWHRLSAEQAFNPEPAFVAFHPVEERLALAQARHPIAEVEPLSDRRLRTLTAANAGYHWHTGTPWRSLLWIAGGLAGGSVDQVYFWPEGGEANFASTMHWPNGSFVALAADAAGRWLAGARGRGVALWDLTQPALALRRSRTFKVGEQVNAVALTPDGRTLLAGGDDWTVHVWDRASGQKRADYNWRLGPVIALATSPDGMTVAVSGRKGPQVLIWDLE